MINNILVSIVIPVYNSEKYLFKCLDSVVKQTYQNIEIIIVDNNSTDQSINIINEFSLKDKRIKVYKESRKGVVYARKLGVENSKGKYIASVDSDDSLNAKYIEELLKLAIDNNADMVQCSFLYIKNPEKEIVFRSYCMNIENNRHDILNSWFCGENVLGHQIFTKLVKASILKEVFSKVDTSMNNFDDQMYFIYLLKRINIICSTNKILYYYLYRNDSLSHTRNLKWLCNEYVGINKMYTLISKEYRDFDKKVIKAWRKRSIYNRLKKYGEKK